MPSEYRLDILIVHEDDGRTLLVIGGRSYVDLSVEGSDEYARNLVWKAIRRLGSVR